MSRRVRLWGVVVCYMAAIFYVSALSAPPVPVGTDKSLHALAYLGLSVVVVRALVGGLPRRIDSSTAVVAIVIAVAYAASDEVHQMFVPGRTADVLDLLADACGAIVGTAVCWAWGIISPVAGDEL
ncbi:MAG: VanZ family protein [Acidobacteria bacterium]|nr:VanZ family protein [Acidobacteriota bacterium]